MDLIKAIILGIVQGLAEFLPISSSGHLVLMQKLFGIEEPSLAFSVLLHVGTLIPVLVVYWKDFWRLIKNPFQRMTALLIFGTIPAVVVALLFGDLVDSFFSTGKTLSMGFFITGIILLVSDRFNEGSKKMKNVSPVDAILIGCCQAIAITPAISRSGSTITGALFRGLNRKDAAKFSFMLSVPAILGGAVLEIVKILKGENVMEGFQFLPAALGFIASMITGYFAIKFMIKLIQNRSLKYFSFYVFGVGAFVLILGFLGRL